MTRRNAHARARGAAAVAVVLLLVLVNIMVLGLVLGGARDQNLSVRRLETVRAFYAAEAGLNMAVREIMLGQDEDSDGAAGTISSDGDDRNDPAFGPASVVVDSSLFPGGLVLQSRGSAGQARRTLEATLASDP